MQSIIEVLIREAASSLGIASLEELLVNEATSSSGAASLEWENMPPTTNIFDHWKAFNSLEREAAFFAAASSCALSFEKLWMVVCCCVCNFNKST